MERIGISASFRFSTMEIFEWGRTKNKMPITPNTIVKTIKLKKANFCLEVLGLILFTSESIIDKWIVAVANQHGCCKEKQEKVNHNIHSVPNL